jgi:Zn-dependent protease with chaperone function
MEFRVHKRENLYFAIKIVATIVVLGLLILLVAALAREESGTLAPTLSVFVIYILIFWLLIFFQKVYLIAVVKGNGIAITERQFPEVHALYCAMGEELGLKKLPRLFLIQEGGLLNAFAIRFSGKNYIAIYSEVFSLISSDLESVKFVLGHELGHVSRRHLSKRFWTFPSSIVPFLTAAYSRSCEFTCDNIGKGLAPDASATGLLVLAAGPHLYRKVNYDSYLEDARENNTAAVRFMRLFMSHPYLPERIGNLRES